MESFAHVLEQAGGYAPEEAKRVAQSMLPDILPYDPRRAVAYPENGRLLTDDATDVFLPIFTNGKVTEDKVGLHNDFLPEFPTSVRHTRTGRRRKKSAARGELRRISLPSTSVNKG